MARRDSSVASCLSLEAHERRPHDRGVGALFLGIALFLPGAYADAGSQRPCTEPAVFQGAELNTFVLPYRYVGTRKSPQLERVSRQIAALVHLEVLFSMLKYGSVGGTDLLAMPDAVCDVDNVIWQVTGGNGPGTMPVGRSLVVVWGRLFEQGDQLYVQSYARFLRRGEKGVAGEVIDVPLSGARGSLVLNGTLPTQGVAFPARRISKKDLEDIQREFGKSMVVRKERRLDAPGASIDFDASRPFPYGVTRIEGDWIWIEPMAGGPKGWAHARIGDAEGEWSLRRWLPELAYIDAINGFMYSRSPRAERPNLAFKKWIDDGFTRFERAVPPDESAAAYGLSRAVRGFVRWKDQRDATARADAARLFAEAKELMPEYARARNLAAVTRPFMAGSPSLDAAAVAAMSRELLAAVALDPRDAAVLGTLERLYAFLAEQPDLSPYAADDLKNRLGVVRAARASSTPTQ